MVNMVSLNSKENSLSFKVEYVRNYYNTYGHFYKLLWGKNIHWGLFSDEFPDLDAATEKCTKTMAALCNNFTEKDVILDIGCGPAYSARWIIQKYKSTVVGIDLSEYQLNRARLESINEIKIGRLRLVQGDIQANTFKYNSFSAAWSQAAFFHLYNRYDVLKHLSAIVQPNGKIIFDDLILNNSINKQLFMETFGRLGVRSIETNASYSDMFSTIGFTVENTIDITKDLAKTYEKVLENYITVKSQLHFNNLPNFEKSFENFIKLAYNGILGCKVYSLKNHEMESYG